LSEAALQALSTWNWKPSIVIGTLLFLAAYFGALGPLRGYFKSTERIALAQIAWFLLGVTVIVFALVSPLDEIGDNYLFSAHMMQHALLMVVVPPLILAGIPGWMLRPLLKRQRVARIARILTSAPVALLLFNLDLVLWHFPAPYEATLKNEYVHIVEHLSFIALGVLNWWPLLSPLPELPRLPYAGQILYLILNLAPSAALGWFFISTPTVIYPTYAAAPHVFGLYGVDDQLIGGLMMAMPGGAVYLGAMLFILDKRVRRLEPARRAL
jgi:cytochrome c oxidase assembly factor CtaG